MARSRTDCGPFDAGSGTHMVTSFVPSGIPLMVAVYVARNVLAGAANAAVAMARVSVASSTFFMQRIVTLMTGRALPGHRSSVRETVRQRDAVDDDVDCAGGVRRRRGLHRDRVDDAHVRRGRAAERHRRDDGAVEAGAG